MGSKQKGLTIEIKRTSYNLEPIIEQKHISITTENIAIGCWRITYEELERLYKYCKDNKPKIIPKLYVWYRTNAGIRMFIQTPTNKYYKTICNAGSKQCTSDHLSDLVKKYEIYGEYKKNNFI